uniref:Uncharacterized protein n=1 Tax=Arundo donax TaxID=35708 RepID=A0A0A9FP55_ARUDO
MKRTCKLPDILCASKPVSLRD